MGELCDVFVSLVDVVAVVVHYEQSGVERESWDPIGEAKNRIDDQKV